MVLKNKLLENLTDLTRILLDIDRNSIFSAKCTNYQIVLQYQSKWMSDSVNTKLNHLNRKKVSKTQIIFVMSDV